MPMSHTAMKNRAMIGRAEMTDVEIERITVWFTAKLASSA